MYPTYPMPAPYRPAADPRVLLRRGVRGLGTAVVVLLGLETAVLLALMVGFGWRYTLAGRFQADPGSVTYGAAAVSDAFLTGLSRGHAVLCVVLGVVFLCWFSAARTNADVYRLTRPGPWGFPAVAPMLGRGWAVGAWFVPGANLVLPLLVALDVWRESVPEPGRARRSAAALIGVWWATLLAAGGLWAAGAAQAGQGDGMTGHGDPAGLRTGALLALAGALALGAATVALIGVVVRIGGAQARLNAEIGHPEPVPVAVPVPVPVPVFGFGYPAAAPVPAPAPRPPVPTTLAVQGPLPIPVPEYQPVTAAAPATGTAPGDGPEAREAPEVPADVRDDPAPDDPAPDDQSSSTGSSSSTTVA